MIYLDEKPTPAPSLQPVVDELQARINTIEQQYTQASRENQRQAINLQTTQAHTAILTAECKQLRDTLTEAIAKYQELEGLKQYCIPSHVERAQLSFARKVCG